MMDVIDENGMLNRNVNGNINATPTLTHNLSVNNVDALCKDWVTVVIWHHQITL